MRILAISKATNDPSAIGDMNAEIAQGKRFFEAGFILEGYMDPTYTTAYLLLESPSVEEAQATLATYPDALAGVNTWDVFPLIGLPAISQSVAERSLPLPSWWPQ